MTSQAERARRKKARMSALAAERAAERSRRPRPKAEASAAQAAQARVINVDAEKATIRPRDDGLDWLVGKKRLTPAQADAGRAYGAIWRTASVGGEAALRVSDLARPPGGGGAGVLAEIMAAPAEAHARLARIHAFLAWHAGKIAVLELVCGLSKRPREITANQRWTEQIETTLRVALDDVATFFREERAAARKVADSRLAPPS